MKLGDGWDFRKSLILKQSVNLPYIALEFLRRLPGLVPGGEYENEVE